MLNLEELFSEALPERLPGYQRREVQVALARRVDAALKKKLIGIYEAGTGTGKTLSYLAPAFLAKGPVVISTGTKNLQDQLFSKDIPLLQDLYPDKRIALLKGRANYLCPYHLQRQLSSLAGHDRLMTQLTEVRQWSLVTRTGDINEVIDPEDNAELVSRITSTRDNCLGGKCPQLQNCPLYKARDRAAQADIVIINHHLLFADFAQRDDHFHSMLPGMTALIIDEAHQVPDIARQFFGERVSSRQVTELMRDVRAELALLGNDDPLAREAVNGLEENFSKLRSLVMQSDERDFDRWYEAGARPGILAVDQAIETLAEHLRLVADRSEMLAQCASRAAGFSDQFALLTEPSDEDDTTVHWIDRTAKGFIIHLSPVSTAADLRALVAASGAAWVFVSATLTIDAAFDHFIDALGVEPDDTNVFASPFDYATAVQTYLPASLPMPGSDAHTAALVNLVRPLIQATSGRTFFLFTSYRALRKATELLQDIGLPLQVQGTASKQSLMTRFRQDEGSVLLATQSFWEGVDVRQAGLNLLIIDKLPFPNPDDPLFKAQSTALRQQGGDPFMQLALPRTVLSLKQGFGRLIREESDRGLFVLGDSRVASRSYQHYVKNNLPTMQWVSESEDALSWLRGL